MSMANLDELPVSVVIPTLGGSSLAGTIECLNAGSQKPAEILVCVPEFEAEQLDVAIRMIPNVRVIALPFRGQVAQRAAGFRETAQPFVLQADDDIQLSCGSLEILLEELRKLGPNNAIGPALVREGSRHPWAPYRKGVGGLLATLVAGLVHGPPFGISRMGKQTRSGWNFPVDYRHVTENPFQVEWLPGGCILHHKESLVLNNYYPFDGKAYGEDLLMAQELRRRSVKLWVASSAFCGLERNNPRGDSKMRLHRVRSRLRVWNYVNQQARIPTFWRFRAGFYDLAVSASGYWLAVLRSVFRQR